MFELIARLRSQPRSYRRRVALLSAGGATALIVVLWLVSFSVQGEGSATSAQAAARVAGPLDVFVEQFQTLFKASK